MGLADTLPVLLMDAPPDKGRLPPFCAGGGTDADAGLHAPHVLEWDEASGFMLLTDLGHATMMSALDSTTPANAQPLYVQALDVLLPWQQAHAAVNYPL